jgi:hypothetical protein
MVISGTKLYKGFYFRRHRSYLLGVLGASKESSRALADTCRICWAC